MVHGIFVTPALSRGLPAFAPQEKDGSRVKPGMTDKVRR
jgi:hypothetical protein